MKARFPYTLRTFIALVLLVGFMPCAQAKTVRYPAYERYVPGTKLNKYERKVLQAVRQWSKQKKQKLTYDPRLGKVAKSMAKLTANETNPLNKNEARRLAYRQGVTDGQIAHVVTQGATSSLSIEALIRELDRSLQHVDMTHMGVSTIRKNKVVTTALILSRRLVKLGPTRSYTGAERTVYLRGRFFQKGLASSVKKAHVALTLPSGQTVKRKLQVVDRKFQLPILTGKKPGIMQAQIIVEREHGPEVAALFPIGIAQGPWLPTDTPKTELDHPMESEPALASLILGARKAQGLNLPAQSSLLAEVARSHADDMRENNFFAHVSARTGDVTHRLSQFQVSYVVALENIASAPSPDDIMQEWMNSPSHRANLLSRDITAFGVGISANTEKPDAPLLAVVVLVKQEETADTQTLRNLTRQRLNQERRRLGLAPLAFDKNLDALAQKRSQEVAAKHRKPAHKKWDADVEQWVLDTRGKADSALGIYRSTTVDVVLQAEHRLASFARVGIGISKDPQDLSAPMWITLMWQAK